MHPSVQTYAGTLAKLVELMQAHPDPQWTPWMVEADRLRREGDVVASARKVLGAFGGMGSILDSYQLLCASPAAYDEFEKLAHLLYDEARVVKQRSSKLGRFLHDHL